MEPNVQPDHVHLVVSIPPKYAVSEFRGYCVSTIGLDEEKVRKYVQWREKQEKQNEAVQESSTNKNIA